ncbi:MAG: Gfo/Idh/MocA family protein [Chthoniobacterales bacterium]
MNTKIRWGLIGAGGIARDFAAALATAHRSVLVAVGSRSQESADAFAANFPGCRAHASADAVLADPSVDAVYIATPHPTHADWTIRAARAGKHVLCEKPFAMNAAEAERVFAAVSGSGVSVIEAFKDRFHPLTGRVIAEMPKIGEVRLIEASFSFRASYDPQARLFNPELGGGAILDVGCYVVNFARRIAGVTVGKSFADPVEFSGVAEFADTGTDGCAIGAMRFANGVLAKVSCGVTVAQEVCARIHGTEGWIHLPYPWTRFPAGTASAMLRRADGSEEKIEVTTDRHVFALEADALAETAAEGHAECPAMTWADTLSNMRALDRWRAAIGLRYPIDEMA